MYTIITESQTDERREYLKLVGLFKTEEDANEYVSENSPDGEDDELEYWTVTQIFDI